jgi:nucleoside-diphosphate-sugar epimerase
MNIAIFGATSQIAKDLVLSFFGQSRYKLVLFARQPEAVLKWLGNLDFAGCYGVANFAAFSTNEHFDAIINFIGVGNPAQAAAMGASIFDVTLKFDEMALDYVFQHPNCRYIFLSSGAAYGGSFDAPVNEKSMATIAINNLQPQDWYAVSKLYAECRHRSLPHLPIVDIRVFNYFSQSADLNARFLITDLLRSIRMHEIFRTSAASITRDYVGPLEIYQLINQILDAPGVNCAVDCFTAEPVDKLTLLEAMRTSFGLRYELLPQATGMTATGNKTHYYSLNRRASELFGYLPLQTSQEVVLSQSKMILENQSMS